MNTSYKKIIGVAVIVGIGVSLAVIKFGYITHPRIINSNTSKDIEVPPIEYIAINGLKVSEEIASRRPVAVMVENYIDSRPQSGLVDADIVYEALAEGGITRFMAVYQTADSNNIGPIRSARTYYAEIANELGALYAHVGGNSDVLYYIKQNTYKNISDADEFSNGSYFHRISSRSAPHNVYTSTQKLNNLAAARNFATSSMVSSWLFKDDAPATPTVSSVSINFSLASYAVGYKYDSTNNSYARLQAGKPHNDAATGQQILAKNIIIQFVETHPIESDTPLSIGMDLLGGGKAWVFLDGQLIPATWKRSADARTRYYDSLGTEISFNRGKTWVEIVPSDQESSVTWK